MDMSVSGVSSRRFACDRCRGQKLRCLREQTDQPSCDRCFRADAECRTSPVFRVRSYVGDTALASTNDTGERERAQKRVRMSQYNVPQPKKQSGGIAPQSSCEIDATATTGTIHPPVSFEQTASMSLFETSPQSTTMPIYSSNVPVLNTMSDMNWEAEDSMFYDLMNPGGMNETFDLFGTTGSSVEKCPPQVSTLIQDSASQSKLPSISSPDMTPSTSISALQNTDCSGNNILAGLSDNNNIFKSLQNQATGSVTVDLIEEEGVMQRLAKNNLELISLHSRIHKGTSTVIIEMLVEPIDGSESSRTRLDDILNSTRDFLETLSLLAGSSRRLSANSPRSSTFPYLASNSKLNAEKSSLRKDQSSYASSTSGTDDSNTSSPTHSPPSSTSTNLSRSDMQGWHKPDFASLLLILTSYIHLLRLYVALFSHIHDFLKEISDSDDPSLCPLPGLSFCSFPLQSGNLQTTILIQIITSLFERIERLLGLPREFRINSRESGPNGLLSDEEFVDIVRLVFRTQESGPSESRRGGVKALRKYLKEIKQLLKNSIAL